MRIILKIIIVISWIIITVLFLFKENIILFYSPKVINLKEIIFSEKKVINTNIGVYFKEKKIGYIFINTYDYKDKYLIEAEGLLKISILGYREDIKFINFSAYNKLSGRINYELYIDSMLQKLYVSAKNINKNTIALRLICEDISIDERIRINPGDFRIKSKGSLTTSVIYKDLLINVYYTSDKKQKIKLIEVGEDLKFVFDEPATSTLTPLELSELICINSTEIIRNPRECKFLQVKLPSEILDNIPLDTNFQCIKGEYLIVDIRDFKKRLTQPFIPEETINEYLKSDAFIQSDDKYIKELAFNITSQAISDFDKIRKIYEWMNREIEKSYSFGIPIAREVLESKRGDCNEFSVLFAALSRSIGIPARIALGLVYHRGAFYYHAWNEVYLKNNWIPVDSIFNQFPADATHIKLITTDSFLAFDVLKYLTKLKNIQIISYE
jgi:hypothetical protein